MPPWTDGPRRHSTYQNRVPLPIAIPVFNGERYLRESWASALAQTRPADEVLVMDNASTGTGTREIAESLLPGAVRTAETNLGAVANFNRAVEEASGGRFAWLAADDLPRAGVPRSEPCRCWRPSRPQDRDPFRRRRRSTPE